MSYASGQWSANNELNTSAEIINAYHPAQFAQSHLCHDFLHLKHFLHVQGPFHLRINPEPNNTVLDWSKLNAYADDKTNTTEISKFILGRIENIVGKRENAGHHIFSFSLRVF